MAIDDTAKEPRWCIIETLVWCEQADCYVLVSTCQSNRCGHFVEVVSPGRPPRVLCRYDPAKGY